MFFIASAITVTAQSNFNCSVYNQSLVPGDMVPLINTYQGNNSHAEYGNISNYNYTVACKSNITTIEYGCGGNSLNVLQMFNYTNSHVSTDNSYSGQVCFNTSDTSMGWSRLITATGATPANYECAFSIFNYTDSHVYECDHVNASYNVNIRIAQGDVQPPSGSITIYGPNGTEFTGTRSVILNLTYYDENNVTACRWANDNQANLNNQPWENCTITKAWLLSESYGNKTVYYQINDTLDNTAIYSDSIWYNYTQDYTPPSMPTVLDGEDCVDIDWWNDNETIHACWFNSSDDLTNNVSYMFRLMENGSCYNNNCNFTDAGTNTTLTLTGLTLYENWVYSFDIIAYVFNANIISGVASSDGTRIDITKPDIPKVNSSTHPNPAQSYADATVELNWTAEDILGNGNRSGIAGYSYVLDKHSGTAPDDVLEDRHWNQLTQMTNNGYAQILRANSTAPSPHTYAVFRQLHTNLTENDSVRVKAAIAEITSDYDDLMGVEVYLIKWNDGAAINSFAPYSRAISNIANVSQDIRYADDITDATEYQFDLTVNDTTLDSAEDIYVVVSGITTDSDNRNNMSVAGNSDNPDLSGWDYVCDNTGSCANMTSAVDYAIKVEQADSGDEWNTQYSGVSDGTYYFHVKARDVAGNWGDTAHFQINVAAGGVSVAISSPTDGQIFTTNSAETNISVKVFVTGNASTQVIALHPGGNNHTSAEEIFSTTHIFHNITLKQGQNKIYAIANTSAGAITTSSSVYVIVAPDTIPITNKTLRIEYAGCTPSADPYICFASQDVYYVGVATEQPNSIPGTGGYAMADTSMKTIKIFMSKSFDANSMDDYFADDEFLDIKNPSFTYGKNTQPAIVQNELRYPDIRLGGDLDLTQGKYTLYINHHGVTPDGRVNLSIEVR